MTENEKLRALLAEAGLFAVDGCECNWRCEHKKLRDRIDAALAEPVELSESEYAMHARIRADYDKTVADAWRAALAKMERERDEARAEVETLRAAIDGEPWGGAVLKQQRDEAIKKLGVTLEQVWAAEKERDEARAEVERLQKVVDDAAVGVTEMLSKLPDRERAAYQRGAETMREAAAVKTYTTLSLHDEPCRRSELRQAVVDAIDALPVPEDKP